jgi:hypothetical protein
LDRPLPWYSRLPIAKGLILSDMEEAKIQLDMSRCFPLTGHGTPRSDLKTIRETIADGSMPPLRYRLMHWNAGLSH